MTGLFDGGNIRFIANSRVQWETFTNGYKTLAGSLDAKAMQLNSNTILGGGLMVSADKAGDLGFQTTSAGLSLSVIRSLDRQARNLVSFGFQSNYYSNRLDYSKMVGHEVDRMVLDGAPDNIQYFDVSAGLGWFYTISRDNYYYLGASVFHLNQPEVSFFGQRDEYQDFEAADVRGKLLYRKIVLHGGAQFSMAKNITALPSFIFMDQGPHREIKMGSFVKFNPSKASRNRTPTAFYLGGWIRYYVDQDIAGVDAIDLSLRFDYKQTTVTFSFDFNVSSLSRASLGLGGPELSFIQILDADFPKRKNSRVKCPVL